MAQSNLSKILCMSSLHASLKRIGSIATEKVEKLIFRCSRAANSAVRCQILTKFELVKAFMHVLITCKYHKDWIINSREKVETSFFPIVSLWGIFHTLQDSYSNSTVGCRIWLNLELDQDFMHVLITCKYKKDWMKNYQKVETPSFPL